MHIHPYFCQQLAIARKLVASQEILLWMTPLETPKALQAHHLSIHKFHAQLCHTPSFTHAHTFFTHNFVTHHLPHTTFTHSFVTRHLCHTPSFTHHLCHTPSFTHNFVTHHLSHTTLSHATSLHTHTNLHMQVFQWSSSTTSFVHPSFPIPFEFLFLLIGRK